MNHFVIFYSIYLGLYLKTVFKVNFGLSKVPKIDDNDDDDNYDVDDDDDNDDYDMFPSFQYISNTIGTRESGGRCNQL